MENNQNLLSSELHVDSIAHTHLQETAKWAKFLGIMGIIISILVALAGIFAGSIFKTLLSSNPYGGGSSDVSFIGAGFISVIYIIIAAIYFFLSLFLFRFATRMKIALQSTDQENFNGSLLNLKLVYRIMGIICIIYLAFIALAILFGIGTAVMR